MKYLLLLLTICFFAACNKDNTNTKLFVDLQSHQWIMDSQIRIHENGVIDTFRVPSTSTVEYSTFSTDSMHTYMVINGFTQQESGNPCEFASPNKINYWWNIRVPGKPDNVLYVDAVNDKILKIHYTVQLTKYIEYSHAKQ